MDDECRAVRQRKKQSDPTCCPVCGITVRSHEIEQHFSLEVDRLHKLSTHKSRKQTLSAAASTMMATAKEMPSTTNASVAGCSTSTSSTSSTTNESNAIDTKECWSTYQRIKNNRSARLKVLLHNTIQHIHSGFHSDKNDSPFAFVVCCRWRIEKGKPTTHCVPFAMNESQMI